MKLKRLLMLAGFSLQSCAGIQGYSPGCMTVDVSEKKAVVNGREFPVATAYRGTGGKPGSKKTPIGTLEVIAKEPAHRFGPVLRLGGVSADGFEQGSRGILIHRRYGSGTRGCVAFYPDDMRAVFATLDVGDTVKIMP